MLKVKRVYDPPEPSDGHRVLVDRLWPRGAGKEKAKVDEWRPDLAPTNVLRVWFAHDPEKWEEFRERYRNELKAAGLMGALSDLAERARKETVTLLFGARDRERNNAVVLQEILAELS